MARCRPWPGLINPCGLATDDEVSRWQINNGQLVEQTRHDLSKIIPGGRAFAIFPGVEEELWVVLSSGLIRLVPTTGDKRRYTRLSTELAIGEVLPQCRDPAG